MSLTKLVTLFTAILFFTSVTFAASPPGLSGKSPAGLQDKTPAGWSKGKKKGWTKTKTKKKTNTPAVNVDVPSVKVDVN